MKSVIALLIFVFVIGFVSGFSQGEYTGAFTQWMSDFGRMYTAEEFQSRFVVFKANMDFVTEWNSQGYSTIVELNKFADITNEEYRRVYLGYRPNNFILGSPVAQSKPNQVFLPATVDWRINGSVTGVKDQGQCGSCWSFSATGSVEAAHYKQTGNLVSLSEQNLMDCSTKYGNHQCDGGEMVDAFKYIIANGGIDTESSYPYTEKDGKKCLFSVANVGATISSYKDVKKDSEDELQAAIASIGPVSVAIDASKNSFQLYKTGVYYEPKCSTKSLDHGVLAIGYGTTDDGTDYWIVKNSWGADWGQKGYIWMSRNRSNNCGIATSASYPIA